MHIAYDSQIFRMQQHGGISKYFIKLIENLVLLKKDIEITLVGGIHQNEYLINSNLKYSGISYNSLKRKFINNRCFWKK